MKTILKIIFLSLVIVSCTTKKVVTEYVHDTIFKVRIDTFSLERYIVKYKDSIQHDSVKLVVNEKGDVIYQEVFRDRYVKIVNDDSLKLYKAKLDSLQKAKVATAKVKVTETKQDYSGWLAFGILVTIIAFIVLLIVKIK